MRFINRFFAAAAVLLAFAACEKSGSDRFLVQTETFSGERLELTYSGNPMSGKTVLFTPDAADPSKATLTLSGENWSTPATSKAETPAGPIKTSGILPGQMTTVIDVTVNVFADHAEFIGEQEIDGYVLKITGKSDKNGMHLSVEVTVPENPLTGKYRLQDSETISPAVIKWDADDFAFADGTWSIQNFLIMALPMIQIDGKTIFQKLQEVLHEVYFLPDGNIQILYSPDGQPDQQLVSPSNLAFYSGVTENSFNLGLNLFGISAELAKMQAEQGTPEAATKAEGDQPVHQPVDLAAVIKAVEAELNDKITNGISLSYHMNPEGDMTLYLDERTLLPILKAVKPIFEDPAMRDLILQVLAQVAPQEMQTLILVFLKPVLEGLPGVIDSTRSMELGIRLIPENSEVAPTVR